MGLSAVTFSCWRRKACAETGEPTGGGFARVRVASPSAGVGEAVVFELRGGISLTVPVGTEVDWVGRLVGSVSGAHNGPAN